MSTVLCVGQGPFNDRCVYVTDEFLISSSLEKSRTTQVSTRFALEKLWNKARDQADEKNLPYEAGILGGTGTNVMKVLSQLGHQCRLSGMIGTDGNPLEERVSSLGIKSLFSKGEEETGRVNCFISAGDKERTMQTFLGSAKELTEEHVTQDYFNNVKHVHFEGFLIFNGKVIDKSLDFTKSANSHATTSIDLGSSDAVKAMRKDFLNCIERIDYIFGNEQEFEALYPGKSTTEAVESFKLDKTVIATMGSRGCLIKEKGKKQAKHYNAKHIDRNEIKDTTGCGDYFAAGILHGILTKQKIEKCVEIGNLAATYVIRQLGADLKDHTWRALKKDLEKITQPELKRRPPKARSAEPTLATRNQSTGDLVLAIHNHNDNDDDE